MTTILVSTFICNPSAVVAIALEIAWKSGILCLAAGIVHLLAGPRRVLLGSAVWHVCLVGLLLVPIVVACGPRMPVAVFDVVTASADLELPAVAVESAAPVADADAPAALIDRAEIVEVAVFEGPIAGPNVKAASSVPASDSSTISLMVNSNPQDLAEAIAVAVYVLVAAGFGFRLATSLTSVAALRRTGTEVVNSAWKSGLDRWNAAMGLRSGVVLRESVSVSAPVVIGWRRPVILLPVELAQTSDRQAIDAVLLHELTHIARGDFAWNLLLRVVQAIYWPHPLIWLAGHMVRQVREEACDAVCIHWMGDVRAYCGILVDVAAGLTQRSEVVLGMAMSRSSRLSRRLARIENSPGSTRGLLGRRARWGIVLLVGGFVAVLGAVRIVPQVSATERNSVDTSADAQSDAAVRRPEVRSTPDRAVSLIEDPPGDVNKANSPSGKTTQGKARSAKTNLRIDPESKNEYNEYFVTVQDLDNSKKQRITTVKVRRGKIEKTVFQSASLEAFGQVSIRLRNAGIISKAPVEVGDLVRTGQVLAELDVPDIDAEIAEKEAALAQAEAAEEQARASVESAEAGLAAHEANVLAARAENEKAASNEKFRKLQYERMKKLVESKTINTAQLEEIEEQFEAAVAATKSSGTKVQTAQAELFKGKVDVRVAQAAHKAAALRTAAVKADVGRSRSMTTDAFRLIRSPIDGVVLEKNAEEDVSVEPGDAKPLYRLAATGFITVVVQLGQGDAVQVKRDNLATVEIDALPNHVPMAGKVSRVAYAIDRATDMCRVEITIPNPDGRLKPGLTGTARIVFGEIADALSVPIGAVERAARYEDGDIFANCFRVEDGRAENANVKLGYVRLNNPSPNDRAEVLEGLKEGDEIVLHPPRGLRDGRTVEAIPPKKK